MVKVSISQAWEESRAVLMRDGKLFASVALALIALPAALISVVSPGGFQRMVLVAFQTKALWVLVFAGLDILVMLAGQLAITRLATAPAVSVGEAISHSFRRLPVFFAAALLVGLAFLILLFAVASLIGLTSAAHGSQEELAQSPTVAIAIIGLIAFYFFLLTRIIGVSAAVATNEAVGPVAILRRSWSLTAGNSWRLLGFLLTIAFGSGIVLFAISAAAGVVVQLLFGAVRPLSASALTLGLINALASTSVTVLFAVMLARIYVQLAGGREVQPGVPSSGI